MDNLRIKLLLKIIKSLATIIIPAILTELLQITLQKERLWIQ